LLSEALQSPGQAADEDIEQPSLDTGDIPDWLMEPHPVQNLPPSLMKVLLWPIFLTGFRVKRARER